MAQLDSANKKAASKDNVKAVDEATKTPNWYQDRYQQLSVQRNLFFFIAVLCIAFIGIDIVVIGAVISKKKIEPLVITVDEASGMTTLVNPIKDKSWGISEAVNNYFLISYLRARESYNVASYLYNYNTVVRLLSSPNVYREFKNFINDPANSPVLKYSSNNTTRIEIRSILMLKSSPGGGQNAQIRFSVVEEQGGRQKINKIASIIWDYVEMDLNFDEKTVNPLGFQVQFYTVSDDVNA